MAVSDKQWNLGTEILNGSDGDTARAAGTKYNEHVHQTTDVQAALDGAASPSASNVFATMDDIPGGGGGGSDVLEVFTHTTASLNGDSSGAGPRYEDFDLVAESDYIEVVNVAIRRVSGTGTDPSISLVWHPDAAYGEDYTLIVLIGSAYDGKSVPVDGSWLFGPMTEASGALISASSLLRDAEGTNRMHLRAKLTTFGTHPEDDAAFQIVIHYRNLSITLPE